MLPRLHDHLKELNVVQYFFVRWINKKMDKVLNAIGRKFGL